MEFKKENPMLSRAYKESLIICTHTIRDSLMQSIRNPIIRLL
jgi:hypothetical protein